MPNVATVASSGRKIARPLKVLVPLIQNELQQGNSAGREHYRHAGAMLIEAKEQVAHGGWGRWLAKNFDLSQRTAREYMNYERQVQNGAVSAELPSAREVRGSTARDREGRQSSQQQAFRRILRDVTPDDFAQERQARKDENELHRDLAIQLIDLGYRALATRLHPDRGGSKDAMARLNVVRDELKSIAATRRFV